MLHIVMNALSQQFGFYGIQAGVSGSKHSNALQAAITLKGFNSVVNKLCLTFNVVLWIAILGVGVSQLDLVALKWILALSLHSLSIPETGLVVLIYILQACECWGLHWVSKGIR